MQENKHIIVTLTAVIGLIIVVAQHSYFAPYNSCVRSLEGAPIVNGNGLYTNALAARVCAGRLGGGGAD